MKRLIPLLVLCAFVSGCDWGAVSDGEETPDPATLAGTLELFVDAWNDCDYDAYAELINADTFIFYFDEGDVGGDVPAYWGPEEELQAAENIFDCCGPGNISLAVDWGEVEEPDADTTEVTLPEVSYHLRLYLPDDTLSADHQLRVSLVRSAEDGRWRLDRWWDLSSQRNGIYEYTWGYIKTLY